MLREDLEKRILILDGAMGTVLQKYDLTEVDFAGKAKGCYEILNETRPDIIKEIHEKYIQAGADIIETNSFNCNAISLKDYGFENKVFELAKKAGEIAREASKITSKKIYILGSIGPTNKSLSFPIGDIPFERSLSFKELLEVYKEQIRGLIAGGVDGLLIETIFDGLNGKAAVLAAEEVYEELGLNLPICISATVNRQGKLLTGQSIESLIASLDGPSILSFGFNCSFGAKDLVPLIKKIQQSTTKFISLYPNAGLPNQNGDYVETAEQMKNDIASIVENQEINILGGCCGTTYEHIKVLAELVKGKSPRKAPKENILKACLSGNEIYRHKEVFTCVGERNNISGSKLFRTMIEEKNYLKALDVARQQIETGAKVIDVNLDDGIMDSKIEMRNFLRVLQNDSFISKVPIMIDSSDFEVIEEGLQNIAGKAIVNSISLKEGEREFLRKAKIIRKYRASIVVMAFDEQGQGVDSKRKIEICQRSYNLLKSLNISDEDIFFDPNILSIGTGEEAARYHGREFLKCVDYIKKNMPKCGIVGGLSNLSFAFRGNNPLRTAMHNVFLMLAKPRGFNFAILNPKELSTDYKEEDIKIIEDFILGNDDNIEKLLSLNFVKKQEDKIVFSESPEDKIKKALIQGGSLSLVDEIHELLKKYTALEILENILMSAMQEIGKLFENGDLYLPQLIRSASVMNDCVNTLTPYLEKVDKQSSSKGKILMSTVDGDVHDIGKNIVGTVLECNGYEVIDLGVMVKKEKIVEMAKKENVDIITLSGLISPSLKEMEKVAELCKKEGLQIPVLIAGAATSRLHTGMKVLPNYDYSLHITDAMDTVSTVSQLLSTKRKDFIEKKQKQLINAVKRYEISQKREIEKVCEDVPKENRYVPKYLGKKFLELPVVELEKELSYDIALYALRVKNTKEEEKTLRELKEIFEEMKNQNITFRAAYGYFKVKRDGNQLEVEDEVFEVLPEFSRYIEVEDYLGAFVISVESQLFKNDKYKSILELLMCNSLAETASQYMEKRVSDEICPTFLRPAVGYPMLADHSLKRVVFDLVDGEKTGAKLSSSYAMSPLSSVCGFYISNDRAKY
ncbi:homocysteine S-methyltransferase family protein [Fusobacterium gastrosuis]|uniref:homocysteine S-methyltransferase family protein n=1 Tax=Fusobacterium gastrosuis TaxID=1755100 RepID=UPI00297799CE|nr:homocysteine S-methyltransferase family protein [Fusobacteriaceae bacterium]MDY5712796.1 homocysteine S-methyltransferase family protein [Fusobacterium gastrosuis]